MADTAEETGQDGEERAPRRRRMGTLVLLGGILGGLALGAVAMYFLTGRGETSAPAGETDEAEPAADTAREPAVDLLIVPVRRFAVPLIDGEKDILGYMWVDLAFEVDGPADQSYVAARLPELRDAFLRDLHTRTTTRADRPGALDFDLLNERLEAATASVVGEGRVLAVRIVNAQRVPE